MLGSFSIYPYGEITFLGKNFRTKYRPDNVSRSKSARISAKRNDTNHWISPSKQHLKFKTKAVESFQRELIGAINDNG